VKCVTEMISGAMICILSFIKIGSAIQKFIKETTQNHTERTQHRDEAPPSKTQHNTQNSSTTVAETIIKK
jgi:hypothetical protein